MKYVLKKQQQIYNIDNTQLIQIYVNNRNTQAIFFKFYYYQKVVFFLHFINFRPFLLFNFINDFLFSFQFGSLEVLFFASFSS